MVRLGLHVWRSQLVRLVDIPGVVGLHGWCGRLLWLVRSLTMSGAAGGHHMPGVVGFHG